MGRWRRAVLVVASLCIRGGVAVQRQPLSLGFAARRVASLVGAFESLHAAFDAETDSVLRSIRQSLDSADVSLLEGQGEHPQQLQAQFSDLKRRCAAFDAPSDEAAGEEVADDSVAVGRILDEASSADLAANLQSFARELEVHFTRVRFVALPLLSEVGLRRLLGALSADTEAASEGEQANLDASVGDIELPQAPRKFRTDGSARSARDGRSLDSGLETQLAKLSEAARRSSLPEVRLSARRLAAQFAQLREGGGSLELDRLARDVEEALARAEDPRHLESASNSDFASARQDSLMSGIETSSDVNIEGCSAAAVRAAAIAFDRTLTGFRGPVLQAMLPPEVDGLHRVAHSMGVLKNSLLHDLSDPNVWQRAEGIAVDCRRYLAGVSQLEADLARYSEMVAPRDTQVRRAGRATLPTLEVSPRALLGGSAAVPGEAAGERRALNVGSFR